MLILTIRTDRPKAEVGLYIKNKKLGYIIWEADRKLADTIHKQIASLLGKHSKKLEAIEGVVCFTGPGSFTGLRIGITVGNALAYSLKIPIAGSNTEDWIEKGIIKLTAGENDHLVRPKYGSLPHITSPKH